MPNENIIILIPRPTRPDGIKGQNSVQLMRNPFKIPTFSDTQVVCLLLLSLPRPCVVDAEASRRSSGAMLRSSSLLAPALLLNGLHKGRCRLRSAVGKVDFPCGFERIRLCEVKIMGSSTTDWWRQINFTYDIRGRFSLSSQPILPYFS